MRKARPGCRGSAQRLHRLRTSHLVREFGKPPDRGLADPYRIAAFTKARKTVADLSDAEVLSRAEADTLHLLPAIGAKTAGVIRSAVLGLPDPYVDALEEETAVGLTDGGAALRRSLKGDLHTHTDWSDGGASIESMARAAARLGHEYLAVTDHSGRLTVAEDLISPGSAVNST